MNNLTEIKNHKIIYDGKDGKLLLPLNFGAIKELAPWVGDEPSIEKRIKGIEGFPYILLTNDKSYVIVDKGSKMPTLYSGNYLLFHINGYHSVTPHELLAHKKEIATLLRLKYTPKQRIKFNMPYTKEELISFSNENQFAKAIYDVINGDRKQLQKNIDKLYNFLGEYVVEKGDAIYGSDGDDWEKVEFDDYGIKLFTSESLYREKYLGVDEDDEWVFNTAMGTHYDDCEEMDTDELNYIDYHFTPQNNEKFVEIINKYEPDYWDTQGLDQNTLFNGRTEGLYNEFLDTYFEQEWAASQWDILNDIGCAVWRARKRAVKEEIENEITYEMNPVRENGEDKFVTDISYNQLLQLVGSLGIKNFGEIRNWDINLLPYNLTDTWYDGWDIDDEGHRDINMTMTNFLEFLDKKYDNTYQDVKKSKEDFQKILKDLGFDKSNYGWGSNAGESWLKKVDAKSNKVIKLQNFDPAKNTVTMIVTSNTENKTKRVVMDVEDIAVEVTNHKLELN
eukprot:SAG11_NODE_62_length_19006_cov_6.513143_9_plen_506_part_00